MATSLAIHAAVIAFLSYHPAPQILKPEGSLRGNGGSKMTVTELASPGASVLTAPAPEKPPDEEKKLVALHREQKKKKQKEKEKPPVEVAAVPAKALHPGMPGYILGSLSTGFVNDHDVKVAYPVVAPDPPIVRAKLPEWIQGDVIVEVTISEQGEVTQTVVLSTVGFGLEDIIVQTLRQWHFTPAKVDGISVASRQDVRFHFPS